MKGDDRLDAVLDAIAAEARRRPDFLRSLERALRLSSPTAPESVEQPSSRPHRRAPAVIDPFRVLRDSGTKALRAQLAELSLSQLHDVVAEYRIEPYALAMRWKTPGRLIDLITDTIEQRSRKGDAFRSGPTN